MYSERIGGYTAKRAVIREKEFRKKVKTKRVLIDVKAISEIFEFFVSNIPRESACLLRGKIEGEYLVIKDVHKCEDSNGTGTEVTTKPSEFSKANKDDGLYVVGGAHSHPGLTVFLSSIDLKTQSRFQQIFPDFVSMVVDPLHKDGISFKFYRVENSKAKEIGFDYLVSVKDV